MRLHDQADHRENHQRAGKDQPLGFHERDEALGNKAAGHAAGQRACADLAKRARRFGLGSFFEDIAGEEPEAREHDAENSGNENENIKQQG